MELINKVVWALVISATATVALAAPPAIVTQGSGAATACATCHGVDGAGNAQGGIPVLAQLPEEYFGKQIADFKSGARSHPIMTNIAKALTEADIKTAAKYYAGLSLPDIKTKEVDAAILARGEELAMNGDWARDIPPCFRCHAMGGGGVPPVFPPIAGQHASYTVSQLKAWQNGSRDNDPQQLMKSLVQNMKEEDMRAVAQYLATLDGSHLAKGDVYQSKVQAEVVMPPKPDTFVPPPESAIPDNEFGQTVLLGKHTFINTQRHAGQFVGNGLNCANCHLDNGRKAGSAPLWAAYVLYPAYRRKTQQVDTIQSRIQGCFIFSMDGTPPPADSKEMNALVTYMFWLASGAPTGVKLPGQGFISLSSPPKTPDIDRGAKVFKENCVLCHGENGEGTRHKDGYAFPPLWGDDSFNWGAGMHRINTAAGFIKANMPYGRGGTLTDQEAWDVALYMNSQDRPDDPRFDESTEKTRDRFHDENCLYGRTPAELADMLAKKQTDKQKESKEAPNKTRGISPATAHELPER